MAFCLVWVRIWGLVFGGEAFLVHAFALFVRQVAQSLPAEHFWGKGDLSRIM